MPTKQPTNVHTVQTKYLTSQDLHDWFEKDKLDKSAEVGTQLDWRSYHLINAGWTIVKDATGVYADSATCYLLSTGKVQVGTDGISISDVVAFKEAM